MTSRAAVSVTDGLAVMVVVVEGTAGDTVHTVCFGLQIKLELYNLTLV